METVKYAFESRKKALDVLIGLFAALGDLSEATVLIGGWVPFFFGDPARKGAESHIGSLDIDLMVDHEALKGRARELLDRLDAGHFYHSYSGPRFSFCRDVPRSGNEPLVVKLDLVTSDFYLNGEPVRYRKLRQLTLRTARAGGIAFLDPVSVTIDRFGAPVRFRLVNPVGFLALKGMVMAERERPKDFYDVHTLLTNCIVPVETIIDAVRRMNHPVVSEGLRKIRMKFSDPEATGPYGVTSFFGTDGATSRARREEVVDVLDQLLVPLGHIGRPEPHDDERMIDFSRVERVGDFPELSFDYPDLVERMLDADPPA